MYHYPWAIFCVSNIYHCPFPCVAPMGIKVQKLGKNGKKKKEKKAPYPNERSIQYCFYLESDSYITSLVNPTL